MRSHKRVEQLATTLNHGVDFTTASAKVRVVVKGLPQVVDRLAGGLSTRIDENTNLGLRRGLRAGRSIKSLTTHLKHAANGIEQPSVRVDLFLVLSLDDQNDLDRNEVVGVLALWYHQLRRGID